MSRTVATREYLVGKGFTEDRYSFQKDEFTLMKTTLDIFYEVIYQHEIIGKVTRTVEDIEEIYEELTNKEL
tara:strand:- start:35816 stop:36028 length:213 start_codon:yes stop_codon:yes gene_type:complete